MSGLGPWIPWEADTTLKNCQALLPPPSIWAGAKYQANVATKREGMQIGFACAGVWVLNNPLFIGGFFWGGLHNSGHYLMPELRETKTKHLIPG